MTRAMTSPLSREPIERTHQLVRRSAPNPDRPRLPDDDERVLADCDARNAACYAAIEDATDRLSRAVEDISADGVVFEPIDDPGSLPYHLRSGGGQE